MLLTELTGIKHLYASTREDLIDMLEKTRDQIYWRREVR